MNITIFPTPIDDSSGGGGDTGSGIDYKIGQTAIFNPNNVPDGFVSPNGNTYNLVDYPQLENIGFTTVSQGDISSYEFTGFGGNINLSSFSKTKQFFANGKNYVTYTKDDGAGGFEIGIGEWDNFSGFIEVNSIATTQDLSINDSDIFCYVKDDNEILIGFGHSQIEYIIFNSTTNSIDTGGAPLVFNNTTELNNLVSSGNTYIVYNSNINKWLLFCNITNSNLVDGLHIFSTSTITDDTSFVKESEAPNNVSTVYTRIIDSKFYYNGSYYLYGYPLDASGYYILKIDETTLDITIHKDIITDFSISKGYLDSQSTNNFYTNVQIDESTGKLYQVILSEPFSPEFWFIEYDIPSDTFEEKFIKRSGSGYTVTGYIMKKSNNGDIYHFFCPNRFNFGEINVYTGETLSSNQNFFSVSEINGFNIYEHSLEYNQLDDTYTFCGYQFSLFGTNDQIFGIQYSLYDLPYDSVIVPEYNINGLDFQYAQTYIYIGEPNIVN